MTTGKAVVGIIMGSQSDWPTLKKAAEVLDELQVPYETKIVSAHRTPKRLYDYAQAASGRGLKIIIAGAGGAAHLPGMTASLTHLPVLGVPVATTALAGQDSLFSIVQMPAGVPVGTLAIGETGAINAGLLAAQILALADAALAKRVEAYRAKRTASVAEAPKDILMRALPPGSTIGILGGGQLGRMLVLAAARLGFKCHIYTDVDGPACQVAAATTLGAFDDLAKVEAFAATVDVVTYEFENVPLAAAAAADAIKPVRPGPKALQYSQDRLEEKLFVSRLGIPVAPFAAVEAPADFDAAVRAVGTPAILKTRRLGYDGKGQVPIATAADLPAAFDEIGRAPATLEGFVNFAFEVSVLLVRGLDRPSPLLRHPGQPPPRWHPARLDRPLRSARAGIATERARSPRASPPRSTTSACWRSRCSTSAGVRPSR